MLSHKEFYFWLDGYLSAKSKEDNNGNVYYMDVFPIIEKMKKVEEEDLPRIFTKRGCETKNKLYGINPVEINIKKDNDLGYPPKIVM